jgi:hypothetical protein
VPNNAKLHYLGHVFLGFSSCDIVEALQGLKISVWNNLLMCLQLVTLKEEDEYFSDNAKTTEPNVVVELDLDDGEGGNQV